MTRRSENRTWAKAGEEGLSSSASCLDFFFDPACPSTWLTSPGVVDVSNQERVRPLADLQLGHQVGPRSLVVARGAIRKGSWCREPSGHGGLHAARNQGARVLSHHGSRTLLIRWP